MTKRYAPGERVTFQGSTGATVVRELDDSRGYMIELDDDNKSIVWARPLELSN